ncbi:unnamed protein product, partial [marine sediment metagenome]
HRLGPYNSNILDSQSSGYTKEMVGRTSGFKYKSDAEKELKLLGTEPDDTADGYTFSVVKVKLTEELMSGQYANCPVIAGRHIEFLE